MISRKILSIACSSLLVASHAFADVTGKITLDGKPPAEAPIKFDADPKCKAAHSAGATTRHYVVDASGGLANVFVYVKDGLKTKPAAPTTPLVLDQKGCLYDPYVLGVQVGQPVTIENSDDTLHNVHALAKVNPEFNLAQPGKGVKNDKTFTKPEVFVKFKCDVHPWMFAYVGVVDSPYFAVTGADGSFKIAGLPDGEYTIAAIHPKIGTEQTAKVKVTGGTGKADFKFAPKAQ
jgi:plastocyanin